MDKITPFNSLGMPDTIYQHPASVEPSDVGLMQSTTKQDISEKSGFDGLWRKTIAIKISLVYIRPHTNPSIKEARRSVVLIGIEHNS
jgi:hypothetical protein